MRTTNVLCAAAAMCLAFGALAQNEAPKPALKPLQPAGKQPEAKPATDATKKPGDAAPKAIDPNDPMMKAWMAYATPGQNHGYMAAFEGKWEGEVTMWMKPGAEPEKSPSTVNIKMQMDGRYLNFNHKGDFNGMEFHGIGTWGYNNLRKKFESTWYDNMGTGLMYMTGTSDSSGKVFTFTGEVDDPMAGKVVKARQVTTLVDSNSWKMEFYQPGPDGKEFKNMEINYKRDDTKMTSKPGLKPAARPVEKKTAPASPK